MPDSQTPAAEQHPVAQVEGPHGGLGAPHATTKRSAATQRLFMSRRPASPGCGAKKCPQGGEQRPEYGRCSACRRGRACRVGMNRLLSFALIIVAAACSQPPPRCDAMTCATGCCSAAGTCESGFGTQCGRGGAQCVTCSVAETCSFGTCAPISRGNGGGTAGVGGGTAGVGGGTAGVGGGTANGGGAASVGGGTASVGGGTANVGGGTASVGGGTANGGGGAAGVGGGTAGVGGGTANVGGGTAPDCRGGAACGSNASCDFQT